MWSGSALKSLFFPPLCAGCESVLADDAQFVCPDCRGRIRFTEEAWHRGNNMEQLFRSFTPYRNQTYTGDKFVRGAAWTYYDKGSPMPAIIHNIKFVGYAELAQQLGREAAETLQQQADFFERIDLLMPITLHPKRLRARGFNQSEWICRGISDVTGIPVDTRHLMRTVNTDQQSLKTYEERGRLGQIFAVESPEELRGKHVLVVDDVITTGSTIARALETLHPIRNCTYSVFALSYAMHVPVKL